MNIYLDAYFSQIAESIKLNFNILQQDQFDYELEWIQTLPKNIDIIGISFYTCNTEIHRQIWNLEWQLKTGVEDQLSLEEIGRRAIAIRDWNNRRISYKNSIAAVFGLKLREIKTDHLSDPEQLFKTVGNK